MTAATRNGTAYPPDVSLSRPKITGAKAKTAWLTAITNATTRGVSLGKLTLSNQRRQRHKVPDTETEQDAAEQQHDRIRSKAEACDAACLHREIAHRDKTAIRVAEQCAEQEPSNHRTRRRKADGSGSILRAEDWRETGDEMSDDADLCEQPECECYRQCGEPSIAEE